MKGKITKRSVDAAKPGERDRFIWDDSLSGFGLKVTPAGRKSYILQYRAGGRLRRYTIGQHGGPWTPDQARREAERLRGEVAAGRDPAEAKGKARHDLTVAELCERYLADGVATKKASTVAMDKSRIARHIKPLLGGKLVRSVTELTESHTWYSFTPPKPKLPAAQVGEYYAAVLSIKRMKTKWGACNAEAGRIWLNLELIKKPPECLDYIIVHELAHFVERAHNERFVELMDSLLPKWRLIRDELNAEPLAHSEWQY